MKPTTTSSIDAIARALLYEGYVLYPYRASSVKNRQRWTFGAVHPADHRAPKGSPDRPYAQTELFADVGLGAIVGVELRFLHLQQRTRKDAAPWQEAVERKVEAPKLSVPSLLAAPHEVRFEIPGNREVSAEGERELLPLLGKLTVSARRVRPGICSIQARVDNLGEGGADKERALLKSFASCHLALRIDGGAFHSPVDPPEDLKDDAKRLANEGLWPVLVGSEGSRDAALASPIILYDYPKVAAESPGDLFDGTEIDEILSLRIRTMTDEEKRAASELDERVKRLIERTDALTDQQLADLHGAVRSRGDAKPSSAELPGSKRRVQRGASVVLRPKRRSDIFDVALVGRRATVESVEEDFEGRVQLCVSIDDDPGKDLARDGIPGHRFFFDLDEVEEVESR